jgi:hypothetical protein
MTGNTLLCQDVGLWFTSVTDKRQIRLAHESRSSVAIEKGPTI